MNTERSRHLPPQVGQSSTTAAMMGEVGIALLPALIMGAFFFGFRVLVLTAISVAACVLIEKLYRRLTGQNDTTRDLSACVTGLLLAMCLPATSAYWVPVLGAFFAIVLVKQFYGGLGKNFMNPALTARMLLTTFPMLMTSWPRALERLPLWGVDAVSAPTPLSSLQNGMLPAENLGQLLLGQHGGCMGEVSSIMLLLGGGYLILRRVISCRIPMAYLGTVAVIAFLFPPAGVSPLNWVAAHLISGGLLLGAFFMATDPTTSPITPRGHIMFGVGCGLLTMLLRYHGSYPDGVGWAILTMNGCVWLLDRVGLPRRFGVDSFTALRELAVQARQSLGEIRFVKPEFPTLASREGKAPGEAYLDQIRAAAKTYGSLALVFFSTVAVIFCVQRLTELDTARNANVAQQERLAQVMPKAVSSSETPYWAAGAVSIRAGYSENNELLGYCVEVQSNGFGGVISMEVGVDLDGRVTGVAIIDHKETPRVGSAAMSNAALNRYVGKSGTIRTTGRNAVEAIAGATATSQAITTGVNRALAIVANLDVEGGGVTYVDGEV